ncbi:MFS transporter [Corynebacterium mendelii]|uniref:MFS transporter n=1 Tax=Corynebacterium mendelii TaxID=2765362 RepID=UPI002ED498D0
MAFKKRSADQSVWATPGLVKTLFAVASAFGSWSLLLPVVPLAVITAGGSDTLAGGTTAAFMAATVITQWFTPGLVRRFGYINVMMASAFVLGFPSFLYAVSVATVPVLVISAVRGIGFGAICVAQAALIAELVEPKFLGKASGMLGFTIGLVQMIVLPIGLYLAENVSFTVTYILATVIAVAATGVCWSLPKVSPAPKADPSAAGAGGLPPVATWKLITVPAITVGTFAMGYGAVSSFLPAAIKDISPADGAVISGLVLGVAAGSQMICRYAAGLVADRAGEAGKTTLPAMACGVAALAWTTLVLFAGWSPWLLLVAAVLFGAGFGAAQNEALLMMFARLPRSRVTDASALWNMAYDGGTGVGAVLLGVVAGAAAYSGAFGTAAGIIAFGLLVVWADKAIGRHRIAERNNTRATLRRIPVARKTYHGAKAAARVSMKPVHAAENLAKKAPRPHLPVGRAKLTTLDVSGGQDSAGPQQMSAEERRAQKARSKQAALERKRAKKQEKRQRKNTQKSGSGLLRPQRDAARRAAGRSGRVEKKFARQQLADDDAAAN